MNIPFLVHFIPSYIYLTNGSHLKHAWSETSLTIDPIQAIPPILELKQGLNGEALKLHVSTPLLRLLYKHHMRVRVNDSWELPPSLALRPTTWIYSLMRCPLGWLLAMINGIAMTWYETHFGNCNGNYLHSSSCTFPKLYSVRRDWLFQVKSKHPLWQIYYRHTTRGVWFSNGLAYWVILFESHTPSVQYFG